MENIKHLRRSPLPVAIQNPHFLKKKEEFYQIINWHNR